jgi:misacylated tRNA(Ala) deacylase
MGKSYDPQMHTAEHILNQTMVRMFHRGRSFSSHLERKKSKCDYHFDRNLTEEEVREIESRVNAVIETDVKVWEEKMAREEAAKEFDLSRLPDQAGDPLRIIRIGNYDACPCIGEHVNNTREIGYFRVISTGFEQDVLRIRFKLDEALKP